MVQLIHAFILSLVLWSGDKDTDHVFDAARAIHMAASELEGDGAWTYDQRVIWLIKVGYSETRFAKAIGEDRCDKLNRYGLHCDHGKAKTYWQCHKVACPRVWEMPRGSYEQTLEGARAALALGESGFVRCGHLEGAFTAYGVPGSCSWRFGSGRAASYRKMLKRWHDHRQPPVQPTE